MPRDGSGVHALDPGYLAVAGQTIQPSQHNPPLEDLSAAITDSISRTGVTPITANIPFGGFKLTGLGDATAGTDALNRQIGDARYLASVGQCRLAKDGSDLRLSRFNGLRLFINGTPESVPSAGVTLSPSGLTVGTLYYIYAYMSGTTMTLEASTTAPATDGTYGHQIKTGDATRTLVGMARPTTGPAWTDSTTQAFVRSYYNRAPVSLRNAYTAQRLVTTSAYTEVNTEIRVEFLSWSGEVPVLGVHGGAYTNGTTYGGVAASCDGRVPGTNEGCSVYQNITTSVGYTSMETGLTQGYHYATLMAKINGGGTVFFDTAGSTVFPNLYVRIGGDQ